MPELPRVRVTVPYRWPDPPLCVVLVEPDIPQNTGAIARLCAATGAPLHLVEPLGFRLDDARVRRAGLDYWEHVTIVRHPSYAALCQALAGVRQHCYSTSAVRDYGSADFRPGDALVFGSESRGLPAAVLDRAGGRVYGLPMQPGAVRSLNVGMAAAVALYDALRKLQADGAATGSPACAGSRNSAASPAAP